MRTERLHHTVLSTVLFLGCVSACAATGASSSTSMTSAGVEGRVSNDIALQQLTNARCNRDERCNLIGPGKLYPDRGTCERIVNKETASDFRASECKGIKPNLLNECANDVTKLACSLDKPNVMMVNSCKGEEMCR